MEVVKISKDLRYTYRETKSANKPQVLQRSFILADKMKSLTIKFPEYFRITPQEAYGLGLIHNIGCMYSDGLVESINIGGLILQKQGHKFAEEVGNQYQLVNNYNSHVLELLDYANLSTSLQTGEECNLETNVKNIIATSRLTREQIGTLYDRVLHLEDLMRYLKERGGLKC